MSWFYSVSNDRLVCQHTWPFDFICNFFTGFISFAYVHIWQRKLLHMILNFFAYMNKNFEKYYCAWCGDADFLVNVAHRCATFNLKYGRDLSWLHIYIAVNKSKKAKQPSYGGKNLCWFQLKDIIYRCIASQLAMVFI